MENEIFAFVLMPFDKEFDDIYSLGIKDTANKLNITAERVDEQIYSEGILDRIFNQIDAADIIIADMTSRNPNVFYEVGYAHAKEKLCILLTQKAEDIPFDLKHKRHVIYDGSIKNLKNDLNIELEWVKKEIKDLRQSNIQISKISQSGILESTAYIRKAIVTFKIDFENISQKTSPDIETAYFYTGKGWTIYQDGKKCASTQSDIKKFNLRHFVTFPVKKLRKNSWAQIELKGHKTMASSMMGDKLEDEYHIYGLACFRLITSKGNFDYEYQVDVGTDDLPF